MFCGPNGEFQWCGPVLHLGRHPVLTLVADEKYPHLFRIRYPDGWISTPANITRAKDAAYGHARFLLKLAARLFDAEAATFEWRTEHSPPLSVHGGDV